MGRKKKFIDKKKAVTFSLVHRSQQDPLAADQDAPQMVLVPVETPSEKTKRIEEQHKYGIYYNDDCNYLEHLKDPADNHMTWPEGVENDIENKKLEKIKIKLPPVVFPSEKEEDVGLLNKAMPQSGLRLDLDPEIVAAMDEDFDFDDPDNALEDNFIELAEGLASDEEYDPNDDKYLFSDIEEEDDIGSLPDKFEAEETKSRFTEYSMSSSVIRRNDQLTLLDDRFEKMFAEYDENEMGALDCYEIEGFIPAASDVLIECADDYIKSKRKETLEKDDVIEKIKEKLKNISDSESEEEMLKFEVPEKERWDCETILSTYSNIYNRPKLISEPKNTKIKISTKTGIPLGVFDSNKLTAKALSKLNAENAEYQSGGPKSMGAQSVISRLSALSIRNKDESPEEKKIRKKALKEYRRERKIEKKLNVEAFKEEAKRQAKIAINNRNNVQGNKIL